MTVRVRWLDRVEGEGDRKTTYYHDGSTIGVVRTKAGNTLVVVKCDDGRVREVPIEKIQP